MVTNLGLLLGMYLRPVDAMARVLDQGSWLFAVVLALIAGMAIPGVSFWTPLLLLACFFVPGAIAGVQATGLPGDLRQTLGRDFAPMVACAGMGFAAATLPFLVASRVAGPRVEVFAVCGAWFAVLAMIAVRTVSGAQTWQAIAGTLTGAAATAGGYFFLDKFGYLFHFLLSPFALYIGYMLIGSDVASIGDGFRRRQSYRRYLEAAALNEHDADAQVQLGLIDLERRQTGKAKSRFERAIEIDKEEPDARFQLGRMAREAGRAEEALKHLEIVERVSPKHSQWEVIREIGAAKLALGDTAAARSRLEAYVEKRPYDPEGLYWYGKTLEAAGDAAAAKETFAKVREAVDSAPRYRKGSLRKWAVLARRR